MLLLGLLLAQVQAAIEFKAEMEAKGLELSKSTYLALLNAFSGGWVGGWVAGWECPGLLGVG